MKKLTLIAFIMMVFVLSSCNLPGFDGQTQEPDDDSMATEISKILTGTPIEVQNTPTSTSVPQTTEEEQPTATPSQDETDQPQDTEEPTETSEPEEPTPTPTVTNTPSPTPTATLADTDPIASLGSPDWVDKMDDGDNWPTGFNDYTSIEFDDGYLKLTEETESFDGWRLSWPYLEDFYLEITLETPECDTNDRYGIIFRVPENANANKGYLYGINCAGQYSLRLWDGDVMSSLVSWRESAAINAGANQVNRLGVMAKGANLTLYINGQKVNEISSSAYLEGSFGVFVGSGGITEDLTVWVDEIKYWDNP